MSRRQRDERGATAILVSVFAITMMVLMAFAVDMGMAYTSTRQLQTASDAASLAAASEYAKHSGECDSTFIDAHRADAVAAATSYVEENYNKGGIGALGDIDIDPSCTPDGKQVQVTVTSEGTVDTVFAPNVEEITTDRPATAILEVPQAALDARPLALCSEQLPTGDPAGTWAQLDVPGKGHSGSDCPAGENGGNWWFTNCALQGGGTSEGSPHDMAKAIEHGCANLISVVQPQDPTTPDTLHDSLVADCNESKKGKKFKEGEDEGAAPSSCLDADTGNSNWKQKDAYQAWETVIGKPSVFPVFCSVTTCAEDTTSGNGTNVRYPVYKLASLVVCAVHIYDKADYYSDSGECSENPYSKSEVSGADKKDVIFWVKYHQTQVSGSKEPSECALGSECDSGLRRVRLVE